MAKIVMNLDNDHSAYIFIHIDLHMSGTHAQLAVNSQQCFHIFL